MVLGPIFVFGLFMLAVGVNPIETYLSMVTAVAGSAYGWQETFVRAAPYILAALAAVIPARAGLVNVGGEGQLMLGAVFSLFVGLWIGPYLPQPLNLLILMLFGALGGLLWAAIPAFLRVRFNLNEVICTVLLNYVAWLVISILVHGPLKDPASLNWPFSPPLEDAAKWPLIAGRAHIGIAVAPLAAIAVWFVLSKTVVGLRMRVVGGNTEAGRRAGFNVNRIQIGALLAGGAMAGLAGMIQVCGVEGRLLPTTGVGFGYTGFLASWIAGQHPLLAIVMGTLLAFITVSGDTLQLSAGLPASSVNILTAAVLLAVLARQRNN